MEATAANLANAQFVDRMIAEGALWSAPVIAAFRSTPRHCFLDRIFQFQRRRQRWRELLTRPPSADDLELIYSDQALITGVCPEPPGASSVAISSSSQPSLMAQMLQDLRLEPGLDVLEVGSGTGYNAALLAHVVGAGRVTSIDVDRDVLSQAWAHLRGFEDRAVRLVHADGRAGLAAHAPYDRIMVTAAAGDLEPAWLEQLADGGLVLAPLTIAPGLEFLVCGTVKDRVFEGRITRAAYFMPLRSEGQAGGGVEDWPPPPPAPHSARAPWATWFDRRLRTSWLGFSQSLAFLGCLQRLSIHWRSHERGALFGVSDPASGRSCWFGPEEWQSSDEAGYQLGWRLWQAFLARGGPWPTEYRLRADPHRRLPVSPNAYVRQGPRCQQCWEAIEPRERSGWA